LGLAAVEEGDLSTRADVQLAQALRSERAALAAGFCAFKADAASAFDDGIGGAEFEGVSDGAGAGFLRCIELKVFGLKPARAVFAGLPLLAASGQLQVETFTR
jgi:hypothetical protein